jgi:hypothetical protein
MAPTTASGTDRHSPAKRASPPCFNTANTPYKRARPSLTLYQDQEKLPQPVELGDENRPHRDKGKKRDIPTSESTSIRSTTSIVSSRSINHTHTLSSAVAVQSAGTTSATLPLIATRRTFVLDYSDLLAVR